MAPTVKDSDAAVSVTTPNSQAVPAAKPVGDAANRAQPVALEVPVTINGARTMEGSDKREPFAESTQTVLVFPQGAVIRLASSLAPGQLVFLTNEKTKKEVVCQVVKSKNYRTVTGYVELEFTEAAAGFWGMRFPTNAAAPGAGAPTAARPAAPAAVTSTTGKPAVLSTQNVVPAKPAVPLAPAIRPETQTSSAAPKSIAPPAAPPRPATVLQVPQAHASTQTTTHAPTIAASPVETKVVNTTPAVPSLPLPVIPDLSDFLTATPGSAVPLKAEKHEQPSAASTEELKQQAAKLQEQLSAMLFSETSKTQTPAPVVPAAIEKKTAIVETASKVLELADLAPKRVSPAPPPAHVSKVTPIVQKPAPSSFDAEEVQIPAWLAPLANNSETKSSASTLTHESPAHTEPAASETQHAESSGLNSSANSSHSIQSEMFGGQLLDDSSASSTSDGSGKSKKGLFIGVAAGLLIAGGAFWYSQQPGNVLTGKAAAIPAATAPAAAASTPFASEAAARPQSSTSVANNTPNSSTPSSPSLTPAKQTTLSESNAAVSSNTLNPAVGKQPSERTRSITAEPPPPAPEPKKPVVGNVQLAKPVVNGGAAARENGEGSPSIDVNQPANGESLSNLANGRAKGPDAPLPVGGDVKQAQLIKSVPPTYPAMAKTQRVSGNVKIDALIDASGNVSSMSVLSGPAMLHQAALAAVKQWRYQPAELDGKPTSMHLTVTVQFRLQ
jgi:TonB family protein